MTDEVIAGRYRLIDPIGSGGSGTVWRAVDLELQQWCAAKILRQRDAGELLRFVREQSVRLSHPHIVSPYAWAADDGSVLIAAELLDGGSLQTLLGDYGPFSDGTITVLLEQLLQALAAVHEAALIHRDVKPGNILLRATGDGSLNLALADFGLTISAQDARLTAIGMVIGTPGYLPPELLAGRVSPEPSHDLFAVGRMAIALAVGQSRTDHAPDKAFDDAALAAAVAQMVAPKPDDRPADAATALALLTDAVRDERPRTRDGGQIVVLDQLPPLPAGREDVLGEMVRGEVATKRRESIRLDGGVAEVESAASGVPVTEVQPSDTLTQPQSSAMDLREVPTTAVSTVRPGRKRRAWALPAAGAGVLAAAVAVVVVVTSQTANPEPPAEPQTESSVIESPPDATSFAIATDAALVAGQACSWQQEGNQRVSGIGDALICTLANGLYTWTAT